MPHPNTKDGWDARGRVPVAQNDQPIIALMMNEIDATFFAKQLQPHGPQNAFVHIKSLQDIEKLADIAGDRTRLLSFCSPHIVSGATLEKLKHNAYNFHPGPPERPGFMPAPFALAQKDPEFGVTFHRMKASVDTGEIVDVTRFSIRDCETQEQVEMAAYKELLTLALKHGAHLVDIAFTFPPCGIEWSGYKTTRKDLAALQAIHPGIQGAEMKTKG